MYSRTDWQAMIDWQAMMDMHMSMHAKNKRDVLEADSESQGW